MDPEDILSHIEENPPEPFNEGCARIALKRILWHFRLGGVYYENNMYKSWAGDTSRKHSEPSNKKGRKQSRVHSATSPQIPNLDENTLKEVEVAEIMYRTESRFMKQKTQAWSANNTTVTNSAASDVISFLDFLIHGEKQEQEEQSAKTKTWVETLWSDRIYATLVLIIFWGYVFKNIMFVVEDFGVNYMMIILFVGWLLKLTCCSTTIFVSCTRQNHFYEFFKKWREIYQDPVTRSLGIRGVKCDKHLKIVIVTEWIVVLTNLISFAFIMIQDDEFSAGMNRLFYIDGYRSVPIIVVSLIVLFYCAFAWITSVSLIVVFCHLLIIHFKEFNQVLKLHILASKSGFPKHLDVLRRRHLAMCNIVDVLNRNFMVTLGIFCGLCISLMCILLYQLVNIRMDISVMCISLYWLLSSFGFIALVTFYTANVHIAMHYVGEKLQEIETSNLTMDQLGQLTLFLAKVNGPPMGFSILGMIVVTRELILTMFGLYITYAVVLLQFK